MSPEVLTLDQFAAMAANDDKILVVVEDGVFDVTDFAATHPGGFRAIKQQHGRDASQAFDAVGHSDGARRLLASLRVASLSPSDVATDAADSSVNIESTPMVGDLSSAKPEVLFALIEKAQQLNKKFAPPANGADDGYGNQWHFTRRRAILAAHPELERDLIAAKMFFWPTLPIGLACAWLHWTVAARWIPNAVARVCDAVPVGGSPIVVGSSGAVGFVASSLWAVIAEGPHRLFLPMGVGTGAAGTILCCTAVFVMAYTVGALCKMGSFGVGHELCHETVHPWLSTGSSTGATEWCRAAAKDIALRLTTAPAVVATVHEYYHNQHIAHHKNLGAQDVETALHGLLDGTQSGDGDLLSANTLLMKVRIDRSHYRFQHASGEPGAPSISYRMNQSKHSGEPLSLHEHQDYTSFRVESLFANARPAGAWGMLKLAANTPWAAKVIFDPIFHSGHLAITAASAFVNLLFLLGFAILLTAHVLGLVLPKGIRARVGVWADARVMLGHQCSHSTLWPTARRLWPQASSGLQNLLSIVLIVALAKRYTEFTTTAHGTDNAVALHPGFTLLLGVLYLVLSDMFLFGFLFHPFLIYFLSVHHGAYNGNPSNNSGGAVADGRSCQPTRSVYTKWMSLTMFNLNYHVEHHDFPSVPWYYLPKITAAAPEFYTENRFESAWEVFTGYMNDRDTFVYGCSDKFVRRETGPPFGVSVSDGLYGSP
jgi:hypothetical protein